VTCGVALQLGDYVGGSYLFGKAIECKRAELHLMQHSTGADTG